VCVCVCAPGIGGRLAGVCVCAWVSVCVYVCMPSCGETAGCAWSVCCVCVLCADCAVVFTYSTKQRFVRGRPRALPTSGSGRYLSSSLRSGVWLISRPTLIRLTYIHTHATLSALTHARSPEHSTHKRSHTHTRNTYKDSPMRADAQARIYDISAHTFVVER